MAELLKNTLFTQTTIRKFADKIKNVYPQFDENKFLSKVYVKEWDEKELKEKMRHLTNCLHDTLPENYEKALNILLKISPDIRGFEGICLPDFVEMYGMEYWEKSLSALKELTKYSSSEFAIRPYIIKDQQKAMEYMLSLSTNENEHVRRFSSEGCRPRLPWAMALPPLKKDPLPIIPILENLKADESEYVRKSVANNLNDISKDHPELVLNLCKQWQGHSKHSDWIIKRACRGLLKAGHPDAMMLFGYKNTDEINIKNLTHKKSSLKIGDDLEFSFDLEIKSGSLSKLRIEYLIDFVKSNGKLSGKIFMITENDFSKGSHTLRKKHSLQERTTRKHYPGIHGLSIIVNGIEKAKTEFLLESL
ncbi:MAG: DNA alkylation repair protein [Bacteroidales bacterium]|nr:DNA alkylation repair protein [Bacteroidales bacterium]